MAGYSSDRVAALTSGKIGVHGCPALFELDKIGALNTHVFSGPATRDVAEIRLPPFMLADADDGVRAFN